jgi:hypothetical protein
LPPVWSLPIRLTLTRTVDHGDCWFIPSLGDRRKRQPLAAARTDLIYWVSDDA